MRFSETSLFTEKELKNFRQRGLSESTLAGLIRQTEALVERSAIAAANTPPLTATERLVLKEGGALGLNEPDESIERAQIQVMVQSLAEERILEGQSLSEAEVATRLAIPMAEVRERALIRPPRLYRFLSHTDEPLYPPWQFTESGAIPYLAELLSEVGRDTHPLGLNRFMLTPSVDLDVGERLLCPRDWLRSNADPEPVLTLARDL